ncbi:MAG: hypothetical protein K9L74_00660 [Candidatus Izimaplasma sp.]|nr:hypothetical protein [Candidatus Izimaplasma bacterium]
MLNRKVTDYIFIGSIVIVVIIILGLRAIVLGSINSKIDALDEANKSLQTQITDLEKIIEENRDVKTTVLYDLYSQVPNFYKGNELNYKIIAILEEIGINESLDMQRNVHITETATLPSNAGLEVLNEEYNVVQVDIFFTTQDLSQIIDLLDALHQNEQLFVISNVDYSIPSETQDNFVGVSISLYTLYDLEE